MESIDDDAAIRILKSVAATRLRRMAGEVPDASCAMTALVPVLGGELPVVVSEGELARAALELLSKDVSYADPIRLMSEFVRDKRAGQRYLEPSTIALKTAVLLILMTRIKFKADSSGKWSVEIEKKSAGDSLLKRLVQRLLPFLEK